MIVNQSVLDEMYVELMAVIDSYVGEATKPPEAAAIMRALEFASARALVNLLNLKCQQQSVADTVVGGFTDDLRHYVGKMRRGEL